MKEEEQGIFSLGTRLSGVADGSTVGKSIAVSKIEFAGIQGSGKSTLAGKVIRGLQLRGVRCPDLQVIHEWQTQHILAREGVWKTPLGARRVQPEIDILLLLLRYPLVSMRILRYAFALRLWNTASALHHGMEKGLEGSRIFRNNTDREDFLPCLEHLSNYVSNHPLGSGVLPDQAHPGELGHGFIRPCPGNGLFRKLDNRTLALPTGESYYNRINTATTPFVTVCASRFWHAGTWLMEP